MSIITNELKKIFNFTNLIIVAIATIIIWNLFIEFEIDYFPNGQPDLQHYNNAVYMLNTYGTSMDEEEFKEYKKLREEKAQEATEYLLGKEEFIKAGGLTYDDLRSNREINPETKNQKALDKIHQKIIFEEDKYLFWELEAMDYEIMRYEDKETWVGLGNHDMNSKQLERQKEVINSEQSNSPLSFGILRNYNGLILGAVVLILVSVAIIISPIFLNDNIKKINYLQYSSKIGRKLFKKKLLSGLIATFTIVTVQLGILFTIYKVNNTYMFWDCSINSAISDVLSWFDFTFGQYIILSVMVIYIVALVYSIIVMFISSKVNSFIALIGIQVPIVFGIYPVLRNIIEYKALGTSVHISKYTLPIAISMLILIGITLILKSNKKELIIDINN